AASKNLPTSLSRLGHTRARVNDAYVPSPTLCFWVRAGAAIEFRTPARWKTTTYCTRVGRFDLWPRGNYLSCAVDGNGAQKIVLDLGAAALLLDDENDAHFKLPLQQVTDPVLARLTQSLAGYGEPRQVCVDEYSEELSLALLDRLVLLMDPTRRTHR